MPAFQVNGVLLDIEGTTGSSLYVYETLFPYARREARAFLAAHWDEPAVRKARELIARDAGLPPAAGLDAVCREVERLMDADVKATGLKELQGLIWEQGYRAGGLCSHVYPDVPPALRRWAALGLDLRIFSSGSVAAQKAFFARTEAGDLLPLLRGHYDTTTGPKRAADSYRRIAGDMGLSPERVLFLSDVVGEIDAARDAGMRTALVVRPGNPPAAAGHGHPVVQSFDEITLEA